MTPQQPTGRALDERIAQKVMGWTKTDNPDEAWEHKDRYYFRVMRPYKRRDVQPGEHYVCVYYNGRADLFAPSRRIADAKLVLERMRELGYSVFLQGTKPGVWFVAMLSESGEAVRLSHESLETAISLAALNAIESTKQ